MFGVNGGTRATGRSWMARSTRLGSSRDQRFTVVARLSGWVGILLVIGAFPALSAAAFDEVVATLSFDASELVFEHHEGYDLVSLKGADYLTEPANPMLPALSIQLLLPPGADPSDVTAVTSGTVFLPERYSIVPAPRPATFSSRGAAEVPQPNHSTYNSVLPYPSEVARLAGVGSFDGRRIATVIVTPLQYVPATGELLLHSEIDIVVSTEPAADAADFASVREPSRVTAAVARSAIANAEALGRYDGHSVETPRASGDFDYLIVCPEALADEFAPLAEWKTRKGVKARIVTLEEIAEDPFLAGIDEPEAIRNCIIHHYTENGISWVLLGGDTEVVPARDAYDFFYEQGIPSDLYYADLDGTWDEDGDGLWGEHEDDGIDMYSDVFVGRAPVVTEDDAAAFVAKVLSYEGAAYHVVDDYELRMLFLGEILWDSPDPYTDGGYALDMIDADYVPGRFDQITKLYERNGTLSLGSVMTELQEGYGIVMHEGHSTMYYVSIGDDDLTSQSLDQLTNDARAGVWYSVGCWSAALDHDAFAEHWLRNPDGGGVAYVGNSRYGWGCPGYPGQCVSDLYSQQWANSLFVKDLVHAGAVHADAKHHYVGLSRSDDYMRYAMYELNLLGDPEMPIWTDRPAPLTVVHPEAVEMDESALEVLVRSDGFPLEGATVCLGSEEASVYEVGTTDNAGRVSFELDVVDAFDATLTVTSHNHVPYGGVIAVGYGATGIDDDEIGSVTALYENYPNPFGPLTTLAFSLAERERVTITIYDVSGRVVDVLIDEALPAGRSSVHWDGKDGAGRDVATGVYFARMSAGSSHFETKMMLVR